MEHLAPPTKLPSSKIPLYHVPMTRLAVWFALVGFVSGCGDDASQGGGAAGGAAATGGAGSGGSAGTGGQAVMPALDCAAFIHDLYRCGVLPPDEEATTGPANIQRCELQAPAFLPEYGDAISACAASCAQYTDYVTCLSDAQSLCTSDPIPFMEAGCQKQVDCGNFMGTAEECVTASVDANVANVLACKTSAAFDAGIACLDLSCFEFNACLFEAGLF